MPREDVVMSAPYGFFIGFLAALVLAAAVLYGLYVYSRRNRTHTTNMKGYLDLIPDLSREQREMVQEIRRSFLPRVQGIRQDLQRERAELARVLFSEPLDRGRIYEVAKLILDHQAELEREVIEHILEEQELLSPSQKKKFYEIIVDQFSSGGLGVHDVSGKH
jgi:Spy/CpxP family protein refolding chaperone